MVCFIILHYMVQEETMTCVSSLDRLQGEKQIIIVDNASANGTGARLQDMYKDRSDVDVLLNPENSGFARGNNLGCAYARETYDPDYYVVMNNDVEIPQTDFIRRIEAIDEREHFDVLGPDIYSTTGKVHQSPKSLTRTTIEGARHLQMVYRKKCSSRILTPLKCRLKEIPFVRHAVSRSKEGRHGINYESRYENVPLHGSCFIFSRHFARERADFFFPGTFFYYESEILDYECARAGMHTVYDPSLKVLHHQNVSTDSTFRSELKKTRFMNEQNYRSISAFLETYGG